MPEGPEVETVRRGLLPVVGTKILEVKVADHKKYRPQRAEIEALEGTTITDITRRGKFMVFYFEGNSRKAALNHLGMTGVWYHYSDQVWNEFDVPFEEYPHWKVYFGLDDNTHLLFVNTRTFGRFEMFTPEEIEEHKSIRTLGPDILDDEFDTDEFVKRMLGRGKSRIKEVGKCLLDYTIVAGCGNIYKSESLFLAKINPFTPANQLSENQLRELAKRLTEVGKKALRFQGSSLRDYRMVDGYSGLMQNEFNAYDRAGDPCSVCTTPILKATQGDRSSFWCPSCQDNFVIS